MKRHLLFLLLIATTALFNSCQKELSQENGGTQSEGLLQSDVTGECLPMTVAGIYEVGTPLVGNDNYIEVTVDVSLAGAYTIYTDTINGMYFRATGVFSATGINTVRLKGTGIPVIDGIQNFIVTYGTSQCSVPVASLPDGGAVPAVFSLDGTPGVCMTYDVQGNYVTGVAMTALNKVEIEVTVTTVGTYSITTLASNGITFSGTGVLATTGAATITLTATGTPVTAGTTNISVSGSSTTCSFPIDVVGPAAFTINCGPAVANGAYVEGVALTAANTVTIEVNVTTAGSYSITGSINGMTFSKTGVFTVTGVQSIDLIGAGTPTNDGSFSVSVAGTTGSCTFPIVVTAAPTGAATFMVNCGSASVNGTYTVGVPLAGSNTVDISVNVTVAGTYTITGTANGMTFSKTGTFTTLGNQTVNLTGAGTPTAAGATNIPVNSGTTPCQFSVTVVPGAGGAAAYVVDCTSADVNGAYIEGVALDAGNFVDIDVNVTAIGTYTITGTVNGMTFSKTGTFTTTGVQTITLAATGTPAADGDFIVNLTGGTTPCSFDLFVFPGGASGTWQFTTGATTYTGTILFADIQVGTFPPPVPQVPVMAFDFYGETAAGASMEIVLIDVSQSIAAAETYNMAVFTGAQNSGAFYFTGTGATPPSYSGDFFTAGTTMVATVISHNVATKTITGTFTGTVIDDDSGNPVVITGGQFTVTYP